MASHVSRLLISGIALLLAVGCRNSSKDSSPAVSPKPAAQAPKAVQPTPTPNDAQAEKSAAAPILVTTPASYSPDQLPQDQPVHFTVQGDAGRFLRVKVTFESIGDPSQSVSIRGPESDSALLEALPKSGDCAGNFVYALQKTGTYQVELNTAGHKADISFSLLSSDDPVLDAGLTPEQISIDFASFAQREQIVPVPFSYGCEEGDETWPTHLGLDNGHFEFHVMQVAGLKSIFAMDRNDAQALKSLGAALTSGKIGSGKGLPYIYRERWGPYLMSARPEIIKGEGWHGLRWIGGYGGDEEYPSEGLGYLFEGISEDGRYFILVRADISHPDQKRFYPKRKITGTPPHTWEVVDPAVDRPMKLQLEKSLAAADPASFQPNLDQLDAVIRSLKLQSSIGSGGVGK